MSQKTPSPEDLLAALGEADRVPLGAIAAWRQAGELMRPAVAGTAVATVAGLALGTYLAVASQGGTSRALAAEPFAVSNLVEDGARGLAATYFGDTESESDALGNGEGAGGSTSLEPESGAPAATDSQEAQP